MLVTSDSTHTTTEHGMLIVFGEFLQQHGLVKQLLAVPIHQKTLIYSPQTKLIEFLAGIRIPENSGYALTALHFTDECTSLIGGAGRLYSTCQPALYLSVGYGGRLWSFSVRFNQSCVAVPIVPEQPSHTSAKA